MPTTATAAARALEEGGSSRYRTGVVGCALVINLLDGFDVLAISFAAPSIASEWALSPERLGILFSAGLVGMVLASIFVAGVADNIGRRPAILISLAVISAGMVGSALAATTTWLAVCRFIVGLGVGTILPSLNTLVAEFAPRDRRDLSVAAMQAGYPAGGILGGVVAVAVITSLGWRGIFWVGAGLSLLAMVAALRFLPESMDFLLTRRPTDALIRLNRIRRRLELPALGELPSSPAGNTEHHGYRALLTDDALRRAALLSLAFFFVMASFYFVATWTPKLLVDAGLALTDGFSGGIVVSVGGIVGGLLLGWQARRFGARGLTAAFLLASAPAMWLFAEANGLGPMLVGAFVMGFFLVGSMMGLYVVTPGLFDARVRATATGVAVGVGRIGAIAGPLLTGYLVAAQWTMPSLYSAFGLLVLLSALVIWMLHRLVARRR
jgi:benzoate transport